MENLAKNDYYSINVFFTQFSLVSMTKVNQRTWYYVVNMHYNYLFYCIDSTPNTSLHHIQLSVYIFGKINTQNSNNIL